MVDVAPVQTRKVGALLGIGIFIFPWLFSWFTLRKGYSSTARVVSPSADKLRFPYVLRPRRRRRGTS